MRWMALRAVICFLSLGYLAMGAMEKVPSTQVEFEKDIGAVVRNKTFYKPGHFEVSTVVGLMPYDSLINHFGVAGRATWHLSDHLGWEVIDGVAVFPSVTSYTTGLARDNGLSNLQTVKLKQMFSTNLFYSPVYGKIRFFGSTVLFLDLYIVVGPGLANTDVIQFSSPGSGQDAVESVVKSGMDPMFDFGVGFKIFMNNAMGLVVDFRDYVVYSEVYGKRGLKSNFCFFAGLSLFLPTF